jgi:ABC-type nitrate/sulfonate/bicarbonate transport system ATPase subunit
MVKYGAVWQSPESTMTGAREKTLRSESGIFLENVGFAYGDSKVLEGITFYVPKGQVWALVGRSGSGKTTLIHIIAGLFRPLTGEVGISGREGMGPGRIRGVVFQEDSLLGWLSVEENVMFPRHRRPTPELRRTAQDMLTAVGLGDSLSRHPFELSAGMQKRLEFARALVGDDEYILADEPFGTVDALTRRDLWRLWFDLRSQRPRTGILATHDPEEAVRLCDAVIVLQRGAPGHVAKVFQIPGGVHQLDVSREGMGLLELKEEIIESLAE